MTQSRLLMSQGKSGSRVIYTKETSPFNQEGTEE